MQVVGQFAILLIQPILLFLMSASVLPRAMPAEGRLSMKVEWASARLTFLSLFALNQIVTWIRIFTGGGDPWNWDFADTVRTSTLGLLIALLFVKDRRMEWVAVVVILCLMAFRFADQPVR